MDEWMDAWMETTKRKVARKQPARKIEIGGRRGRGEKGVQFPTTVFVVI